MNVMSKTLMSRSGKTLEHVKTHKTTPRGDNKAKRIWSVDSQKTRLLQDEGYLSGKNVKAFLAAIGDAEGGDYNLKYGGVKGRKNDKWSFTDYSTHPGAGADGKTTAAGKYQINKETWKEMGAKVGLTDFSAHTQDILAVEILRTIKVIDSIEAGKLDSALSVASYRWAALPQGNGLPGRYNQPYVTYEDFSSSYQGYGGSIN